MSASVLSERIQETVGFLRERGVGTPRATFVLGSGLSGILPVDGGVRVPYAEIPGFPAGKLQGHERVLEFGMIEGAPVLVLRGRVHYYEGAELPEVVFPVRVAKGLGSSWIGLLNAAGGMNPSHEVGDIVLLTDHLNFMGDNPLVGPNDDTLGPRFPDMSRAYDRMLITRAEGAANAASIRTLRGVYAAVAGPTYETPAEIRMLRLFGADLVGMSTVPETIAAVHCGLSVLGISIVTDLAFPEELAPLSHDEVVKAANEAAPRVEAILRGVLVGEAT